MAGVAGRGKSCLGVIGIGGVVVILHVTRGARATSQLVVPIYMALRARQSGVRSGESKTRAGVIETGISPAHGAVANLTGLRYPRLHMVRISGALIILQMAGDTGCIGDVVIAVDVTLRAGRSGVRAGKRKPGVGMVETGVGP